MTSKEQIARWLYTDYSQVELGQHPYVWGAYELLPESDKVPWLTKADAILVLPGILVKAEDQTLPKKFGFYSFSAGDIHREAQQAMLVEGWVKVEAKRP